MAGGAGPGLAVGSGGAGAAAGRGAARRGPFPTRGAAGAVALSGQRGGAAALGVVEPGGFEPPSPSLQRRCAARCATAPP